MISWVKPGEEIVFGVVWLKMHILDVLAVSAVERHGCRLRQCCIAVLARGERVSGDAMRRRLPLLRTGKTKCHGCLNSTPSNPEAKGLALMPIERHSPPPFLRSLN